MIRQRLVGWLRSGALMRLVHWRALVSAPLTLGVRGVLIDSQNNVFLVRHSYVGGWHLPGGSVEVGETIRQALVRELREEGNIVVDEIPRLHGLFFNNKYSRRDHVAVFVIRSFHQTEARRPDWEITGADFFALDSLPQETTQAARRTLAEILEGAPIREVW
jgi:ADP-ribose pyrophosphatase YjhB (NUDIX family)